jgi:hypothetical protein
MIVFNGARFEEVVSSVADAAEVVCDVAIFVASWESRADFLARNLSISARKAVLLTFRDDGLDQREVNLFKDLLRSKFVQVAHVVIAAATDELNWTGDFEKLLQELAHDATANTLAVDYTCLPKAVSQTLFRSLIRSGTFPKTVWLYSLGRYDQTLGNISFAQGVQRFFPIRHTPGDGGMSTDRVGLVGLGSDEGLVFEFLEQYNFQRVFIISAHSDKSPDLSISAQRMHDRLVREGKALHEDFFSCDATSVVSAIEIMHRAISGIPKETSVDIFAAGPKSHAVAACVIAEKYRQVRLMGREAKRYARYEVVPEGTVSVVTVTDFKNPLIGNVL